MSKERSDLPGRFFSDCFCRTDTLSGFRKHGCSGGFDFFLRTYFSDKKETQAARGRAAVSCHGISDRAAGFVLWNSIYLWDYPQNGIWIYIIDGIFWAGAAAAYCGREKINQVLRLDAPYRKLGTWERRFLHICGLFLLVIGFMIIGVKETGMEEDASRIFAGFGSFAVILLEISAVILIHQENQKDYFQYMTTVGEHYLKTELNHFRAYQEREEKIRRFRHDINNHLLCLKELTGCGDLEKAKEYILELQTILGESRQDFYTGNEIADAILNEKNILARAGEY